jgi:hypothetical protein
MPNWCNNTLTVSGDEKAIKEFRERGKLKNDDVDTQLSLAKFVPEPDYNEVKVKPTFPALVKNSGEFVEPTQAWWDWRVQNWGTKWDVDAWVNEESNDHIVYCFDSAWSPPVEWLTKVAEEYKGMHFKLVYREDGNAFMGVYEIDENGTAEDTQIDTSSVWEEVIKDGFSEENDDAMDEYMSRLDAMENEL